MMDLENSKFSRMIPILRCFQLIKMADAFRQKKYYTNTKILTFLLFFAFFTVHGQEAKLLQTTPKSPNVAGLDKYTDVPVGVGSGIINPSVPIYEIEVGNLKIPIGLSYNNNGLKCDEIPSWIGLGWNLSTGGYISYQQRGLNDFDSQYGLFPSGLNSLNRFYANQMTAPEQKVYFNDIIAGNIDSEFDQFNYSFPNNSGSFHFINGTQARTNPKADLIVSKTQSGYKIIDDSGNSFFFESQELISAVNPIDYSTKFNDASAFYITKIITFDNKVIDFKYKSYSLRYTITTASFSYIQPDCNQYGGPNSSSVLTTINYLLPDEITFPLGKVKFIHSDEIRADLLQIDPGTTARYLKGISVFNLYEKIKEFAFTTSYFGSNNRLKLNGIQELDNAAVIRKWDFEYFENNNNFPNIFSKSKDHWGYYNGNISSNNLPRASYSSFVPYYNNSIVPDADRTSNFNFAVLGMLKNIRYPTGGYSEFVYEQNQFVVNDYSDFPFSPFLELTSSTLYSVQVASGNATQGNTITGTFTVPPGGGFYKFHSWKILSPDPFYNGPEIIFSGGDYSSTALLNSKVMECNYSINQCVFSDVIQLNQGTYSYTIQGSSYQTSEGATYYLYAGFDLFGKASGSAIAYPLGGGRISQVATSSSLNESPMIKKYIYNDSLPHVSVKNLPFYISTKNIQKPGNGGNGLFCVGCGDMTTIWEESVKPMNGPVIEYGLVTEQVDNQGTLGRSDKFLSFSNQIGGSNTVPIVAPIVTNWTSGLLLNEKLYKENANTPIVETINEYSSEYLSSQVQGLRADYDLFCNVSPASTSYVVNPSTVYSANFKISSVLRRQISDSRTLVSKEDYIYDLSKHQKPKTISSLASDNKTNITRFKYALDYENGNLGTDHPALGLKLLQSRNINLPIEELRIKTIDNVDYIMGGTLKKYNGSQPFLDELYDLDVDNPIPSSSFTYSYINSSGSFINDFRYRLRTKFDKYDPWSFNLLEQHQSNGLRTCYLYGYGLQYLIAEVKNAAINEIYHQNMEEPDLGLDFEANLIYDNTMSHTGLYAGRLTNQGVSEVVSMSSKRININLSAPKKYTFSGWVYSNGPSADIHLFMLKAGSNEYYSYVEAVSTGVTNKWVYLVKEVTVPGDVATLHLRVDNNSAGDVWFDDLSIYPSDASMTTYTYKPLVGMTSMIDAKGMTSYYTYDTLGRLQFVKDQDGNVVKQNTYHYKN
ncbi:MAG: hypothetical protein EOO45_00340 [Flavobacterium sp.]|nr:MAG: hypothetical protein EOO45_00340 [Flavobacterium sp.]